MANLRAFREALVLIVNNDAAISAITGRAAGNDSENIVGYANIGTLKNVGIGFQVISAPQTGQNKEQRLVRVRFECFGFSMDEANALSGRLTEDPPAGLLIAPNFLARGVDAAPMEWPETEADNTAIVTDGRQEHRVECECVFEVEVA